MEMIVYPVNKLLDDTLNWALDRIRLKSIVLTKDYSPEDLQIRVDVPKMKTALLNIIINAVEAMAASNGALTVRTGLIGNKCRIEIEDNGHGISKENLEKLFDPFFSVKEKGMGLGLTATQNIILTHNATIDVKSELGKGTRFILVFDRAIEP
jgi:signal transduction histidine kinase